MNLLTSRLTVVVLAALMALAPLASAAYLPGFSLMASDLGVDISQMAMTLSAYMAGMAAGQPVYGPLADRWGRRPVLLAGLAVFGVASLGCWLSGSLASLVAWRFAQALGAAAGIVLSQAMVRDTFDALAGARLLASIGGVQAMAPAVGPLLGGLLLSAWGWRSIFLAFALLGATVMWITVCQVPETLPRQRRQSLQPARILGNYGSVLGSRAFVGHSLALACMTGGFYAFMAGAPAVLVEQRGVPIRQFGLWYLVTILGFIGGSFLAARLGREISPHGLIMRGALACSCGGLSMVALAMAGVDTPVAIIAPQALFTFGSGLVMAQLMTGALMPFAATAGTAAAAMGFIQMTAGAACSAWVGHAHAASTLPMARLIAGCGMGLWLCYMLVARPGTLQAQGVISD